MPRVVGGLLVWLDGWMLPLCGRQLDCCYQFNTSDRRVAFEAMSAALLNAGRPILFSCDSDELILHENNEEYPAQWAPDICNIARINWDIYVALPAHSGRTTRSHTDRTYSCLTHSTAHCVTGLAPCRLLSQDSWTSTMEILTAATNIAYASAPGYWNDLDILTVGMGGQSMDEYVSHFQLWCIASSPLIAGNDIRSMSEEVRAVLTHKAAIAINQDRLAVAGNMIRRAIDGTYEVWAKPLWTDNNSSQWLAQPTQHTHATRRSQHRSLLLNGPPQPDFRPLPLHCVVLLNRLSSAQDVLLDFDDLFDNKLAPHLDRPPFVADVTDVWTGQQLGSYTDSFTAQAVRGHASRMLAIRCTNC